jgi:hypothetical protein
MGQSIYHFFWWVAGANREILKQHIGDYHKYFMIGSSITITAMLAMFTGSIAFDIYLHGLNESFHYSSLFFGLIWGMIIFNMDRQIIITMQKKGTSLFEPTAYEKRQLLIQEFIVASPRFVIAIVIAMIIIEPFELMIYKDDIAFTLKKMEVERKNEIRESQTSDNSYAQSIKEINGQIDKLDTEISNYKKQRNTFYLTSHIDKSSSLTSKISEQGIVCAKEGPTKSQRGPNYRKCMSTLESFEQQLEEQRKLVDKITVKVDDIDKSILELNLEKKILQKERKTLISKHNLAMTTSRIEAEEFLDNRNYESLVAQLVAKDTLLDDDSVYGKKYKNIHYILSLLIFLIEILPLIAKIMSSRGAYDTHMARIEKEEAMKHDAFIKFERMRQNKLKSEKEV